MISYDVIVVGGGPGGYVAAIRAAKEGKKTAIIEAGHLGGTCLNRGCIPTKTLLKHAETIEQIEKAKSWGIVAKDLEFDFSKMQERKNKVIQTLRQGIHSLLHAGKIDVHEGFAKVYPGKRVIVEKEEQKAELQAEKIIIATGSRPIIPSIPGLDEVSYHTTNTIFQLEKIPKSIVIIGGGVIGVEFANIFSSLRTNVKIIELGDRLIPTEDVAASNELWKVLNKKGIQILLNHQVTKFSQLKNGDITVYSKDQNGKEELVEAEEVLIAIGREPNVDAVKQLNLEMDGRFIRVNEYLETSEPGIFAIGDVIGKYQLAHVASSEGLTAVKNLDVPTEKMNYHVIPRCIYTSPQIASVGMTETELKKLNIPYKVHITPFFTSGMALASGATEGFIKVMIDERYGEILGVVMVGAQVTEIISQASAFMYLEGTVDELATMVQPHPSLSEMLMENANALINKGIHVL